MKVRKKLCRNPGIYVSTLTQVILAGVSGFPDHAQGEESEAVAPLPPTATEPALAPSAPQSLSSPPETADSEEVSRKFFNLQYYGIFFGPALKDATSYQPTPDGVVDPTHPVQMKNFVGASFNVTDAFSITPTAFVIWTPVRGQRLTMADPFIRVSGNQVINTEQFNLYSDIRFHLPLSTASQESDMRAGFQTFHALTYMPSGSRFSAALYGSARYNTFGPKGDGNDVELYLAPNLAYQITRGLAFNVLYEMGASHVFGKKGPFRVVNDGTDLEPGVVWDVTPTLTLNPYINLYPGDTMNLSTSSIGMTLSWTMI